MTERREVSAGGVVYRRVGAGIEVAIAEQCDRITHRTRSTTRLPKGKIDPGESAVDAAVREVAEEIGLRARVVGALGSVEYDYAEDCASGPSAKTTRALLPDGVGARRGARARRRDESDLLVRDRRSRNEAHVRNRAARDRLGASTTRSTGARRAPRGVIGCRRSTATRVSRPSRIARSASSTATCSRFRRTPRASRPSWASASTRSSSASTRPPSGNMCPRSKRSSTATTGSSKRATTPSACGSSARKRRSSSTDRLGERCLTAYYRRHYPFDGDETLGIEKRVTFALDEKREYRFQGIIDRLVRARDGAIEIHDYKTGRRAATQKQVDEDRQLALYQIGLAEPFPDQPMRLVWHYLQQDRKLTSTRTPEESAVPARRHDERGRPHPYGNRIQAEAQRALRLVRVQRPLPDLSERTPGKRPSRNLLARTGFGHRGSQGQFGGTRSDHSAKRGSCTSSTSSPSPKFPKAEFMLLVELVCEAAAQVRWQGAIGHLRQRREYSSRACAESHRSWVQQQGLVTNSFDHRKKKLRFRQCPIIGIRLS